MARKISNYPDWKSNWNPCLSLFLCWIEQKQQVRVVARLCLPARLNHMTFPTGKPSLGCRKSMMDHGGGTESVQFTESPTHQLSPIADTCFVFRAKTWHFLENCPIIVQKRVFCNREAFSWVEKVSGGVCKYLTYLCDGNRSNMSLPRLRSLSLK